MKDRWGAQEKASKLLPAKKTNLAPRHQKEEPAEGTVELLTHEVEPLSSLKCRTKYQRLLVLVCICFFLSEFQFCLLPSLRHSRSRLAVVPQGSWNG